MTKHKRHSTFAPGIALGGFFGGFIVAAFLLSGFANMQEHTLQSLSFDSATTIIIVLTALSIMLTTLAIIIAVVGAFGFSVLRSEAFNAGAEHASEQLGENGELRSIIETRVIVLVAKLQSGHVSNSDFPNPESEYGE